MSRGEVEIALLGDAALLVTLGEVISRGTGRLVRSAARAVRDARLEGVVDVVPAYTTVAIYFDPARTQPDRLRSALERLLSGVDDTVASAPRIIEIPVRYDGEDLPDVAERTGLTVAEVIERHSAPTYFAYTLGFAPGFAYLGDLDPALVLPRRATPRVRVPAGSVAIAGAQTGVYPLATPGGWHILGRTTLVMFDARRDPPSLLRAGDDVRFVPARA